METFGNITLHNGDCMDVMAQLPDKAFDLAIVDPPYGIGVDGQKECLCKNPKHNRKHHEQKGWDKLPPPMNISENLNVFQRIKSFGAQTISFQTSTKERKVGLYGSRVKPGLQCRIVNLRILLLIARHVLLQSTVLNLPSNTLFIQQKSPKSYMIGFLTIMQNPVIKYLIRIWVQVQFAFQHTTIILKCWELNLTPVITMPQSKGCCTTKHNYRYSKL